MQIVVNISRLWVWGVGLFFDSSHFLPQINIDFVLNLVLPVQEFSMLFFC